MLSLHTKVRKEKDGRNIYVNQLLPKAEHYASTYGYLIHPSEEIDLVEFADRIQRSSENICVQVDADEINRWVALMEACLASLHRSGRLPGNFEWHDGSIDRAEYQDIAGKDAVAYLDSIKPSDPGYG